MKMPSMGLSDDQGHNIIDHQTGWLINLFDLCQPIIDQSLNL